MSTVSRLRIGPEHRGRPLTQEEFCEADWEPGYQYELIDGRLHVLPLPNAPAGIVELWLLMKLNLYLMQHPQVINWAYNKARVFVPNRPGVTIPEPDVAAYRDFPLEIDLNEIRWQDHSPILVAEVLHGDEEEKDLVRNVDLYFQVPTIKEYWVVDAREDANRPTLIHHRRHGKRWVIRRYDYGDTFTTKLLPGFELVIDPKR